MASKAEKLAVKLFGKKIIKPAKPGTKKLKKRYKVVAFTPVEKTDELTFAMASAGAGIIGNYSLCSYRMRGTGTFMGNDDASPSVGSSGKFEFADEIRLEMICDKKDIREVINSIYEVHPYDEPAYEVYEVLTGTRNSAGEMLTINFNKKKPAESILKKINPSLVLSNVPGKIKNLKIERCIIDCTGNDEAELKGSGKKTIYIKKNKKNIKAYII